MKHFMYQAMLVDRGIQQAEYENSEHCWYEGHFSDDQR